MKKLALLLISTTLFFISSQAADLIVDVTGTGGAYSTISTAVDASSPGDRILIYPNATPYSENVSINHTLELTTAVEGERFRLLGSITVNSGGGLPAGSEVTIANGYFLSGDISTIQNATGGSTVNIVGCKFDDGHISFDRNGYFLNVANDSLMSGYVYLRNGFVLGNYVNVGNVGASAIYVGNDATTASDDHCYISGNHVICAPGSYQFSQRHGIYWNSSQKYAHISNNYIEKSAGTYQWAIYYAASKTGPETNRIENNTITGAATNAWSIYIASYNSINKIYNNLITGASMDYGITCAAYNLNNQVSYNYIQASASALGTSIINDGTNIESSSNSIDAFGNLLSGDAIDGGNPDAAYTDLDLSTNDAGCYGGSLSKSNFDGMTGLTGAKTILLLAPRRVLAGETIDIFGIGFDH